MCKIFFCTITVSLVWIVLVFCGLSTTRCQRYNVVTLYFSCVLHIDVAVLRSSQSYLIIGVTMEEKLFENLNGG